MKRFAIALLPLALMGAAQAQSAFGDTAQVVSTTPIMDRVSAPRQECFIEQVPTYSQQAIVTEPVRYAPTTTTASSGTSGAGAVLGAIVGGVVGRQFGNSSGGRDRGTVAGAVVGGLIGNGIESSNNTASAQSPSYAQGVQPATNYQSAPVQTGTRPVERCRTVSDTREQISGYNVTYRYGNQQYTTRLPYDPGQTLRVRVQVTPELTR
jgi:uncharacterized protein YcfJ